MTYRFLSPALVEISEAAEFYEGQLEGLGADFVEELDEVVDFILRFPTAWGPTPRQLPVLQSTTLSLQRHLHHRRGWQYSHCLRFPSAPRAPVMATQFVELGREQGQFT